MCVLSVTALVSSVFVRGYTLDVELVTEQRLAEGRKVDTGEGEGEKSVERVSKQRLDVGIMAGVEKGGE